MVLLSIAAPGFADPKPLNKEEQAKVDKAIERGILYLKHLQRSSGAIPNESRPNLPDHPSLVVGYTILPALALLECGVTQDDPVIQKAALLLRKKVSKLECTYELALAIMFLDRLGDRKDEETIRTLATQLIAGQSYTGGWTYRCPRLTTEQETNLVKKLRAIQDNLAAGKQPPREGEKRGDADRDPERELPANLAKLAVFQKPETLFDRKEILGKNRSILYVGDTDNSNTQFAMLGLWAARRHKLPLVPTFRLAAKRFECSQGEDGSWDYHYHYGGQPAKPYYRTNTAVGLLALAIDSVASPADKDMQVRRRKKIIRGLTALNRLIDEPVERVTRQSTTPDYYLLWTIERVATLYDLRAFGGKDWYRWGMERLIVNQHPRGYWPPAYEDNMKGSYGSNPNTSFALMFLKHSNLTKDLTAKLPFKSGELNKGIMLLLAAPTSQSSSSVEQDNKTKGSSTPPDLPQKRWLE
jgi:hypothetical protein